MRTLLTATFPEMKDESSTVACDVALEKGIVVGCCQYKRLSRKSAEIYLLTVAGDLRGYGIGT